MAFQFYTRPDISKLIEIVFIIPAHGGGVIF